MKNLIVIAGFAVVAIALYVIWGSLNSKLIAIESSTGSYLYDEPAAGGDTDVEPAELSALLDRLAELESAQAENTETIASLLQRVEQLEARGVGRGGRITNREIVYFDFDDVALSRAEQDKIDGLLRDIADNAFVSLVGHADTSGDNQYNQLLSLRRAAVVKRYILAQLQARGESGKLLVTITGTGEESVIDATGDEIRARSNRIVEILVFE
jgi:outer membrane protein OmpA-like peptidoglycan-associated protein